LIHLEICGPMPLVSLSGYKYYVTFIYDDSGNTQIYFMNTKDELFSQFQEFKYLMENQTERNIKTLQSNNGGEYTSNSFKDLCSCVGINMELTISYKPTQNGVSKRNNKTILRAAKEMLYDQDLPRFLWENNCNTTVYI
jgi:transposase InsO family protein